MEGRAANCAWGEKYPETRRDDTTIHEHGMTDPYRWLEDPDSPETQAWVEAQNKVTFELLESCDYRTKVKQRLTELYNYPKYGCPFKRGSRYFYFKNDGLQNQSVLYSQTSLEGEPEVFLDPNVLESDGTAALGSYAFSESGEYFAYGVSKSGSDWQTIHVRKVSTKEDLSEQIHWVKFSGISWTHDDRGFFYSRYPAPSQLENDDAGKRGSETNSNLYHKVYYHRLGTDQSSDVLVFETPEEPHWMSGAVVSDDGRYVTISISKSTAPVNKLYYADLSTFDPETGALDVIKLVDNFDAEYDYITNEGTLFYFKTNLKAPRNKIVSVDVSTATTREDSWKDHVAEQEDVLSYACCFDRNKLILNYIHHVKDVLHIHSLQDGSHIKELELPTIGTITSIRSRKEDSDLFFSFTSFLYPGSIFRYNDESGLTVFRETKVEGFEPEQFKTEQVFYSSKDGTKIPMFIVSKQTAQKDGNQAVYLYGYGGFNISIQPTFSVFRIVFMQHFNVTLAIPNIRGGGEYGEEWHQAGTLERKQNVFDDFCAAAEYLIENKYTKPEKITITGGSNGGLLVGACINQRPELFGCGVAAVGVFDMLRFHKFTIGHAWTADYGCADNEEDFKYLIKYSPVHTVRKEWREGERHPALLLTTADHDDRVVPLHSYKYISALQHLVGRLEQHRNTPLMIRVDTKAGHGAGKPTSKAIEEAADTYTFIAYNIGLTWQE